MASILIIGKFYPPFRGGIETNTESVARALATRHRVTALVNNHEAGEKREIIDGVEVIRRAAPVVISSQPIALDFFNGIDLSSFDLIHFHAPNPLAVASLLWRLRRQGRKARKLALVITHHMDVYGRTLLRGVTMPLYHALIRRSRGVIVTSPKNVTVSRDLPDAVRFGVVPLGVDPSRYVLDDAERAEARNWVRSITGGAPAVGFVGRHARYKGLDILVRAIARTPGVHAVLAGGGSHTAATRQLAGELGVTDRVHFIGMIDERRKVQLLHGMDLFALPSTEVTEAFGIAQVEAMMCGTPVVASDLPTGVTDVAIDGKTALLVPPSDDRALANSISRLIADPVLARTLGDGGRAHVMAHMQEAMVAEQTCRLLEQVIAGGDVTA